MDIHKLTAFLMWCTIINGAILIFSIAGCILAPDMTYDIQTALFNIPRETVDVVVYAFLGLFKIFWLIFNLVPYVALLIVEPKAT